MTSLRHAGRGPEGRPEGVTRLAEAAAELLEEARGSKAGRSARTLLPGAHAPLKQTLIALLAGESMDEHESPTAATLQVLAGRVRLAAAGEEIELGAGDHILIPQTRHHLDSVDDAVVLLTVTP